MPNLQFPQRLTEEEIASSFRGKESPGGTWAVQQHEKAFTLITVGLSAEFVTQKLPNGETKTGYPFWYSIITYEAAKEQGIRRPTEEFEGVEHPSEYWKKIQQEYVDRVISEKPEKYKDLKYQFRIKGKGLSDEARYRDAERRSKHYEFLGLDPERLKKEGVTIEERDDIVRRYPEAIGDFVEPSAPLAEALYDESGKLFHPKHMEDTRKVPSGYLGEPTSPEEVEDYSKLIPLIKETVLRDEGDEVPGTTRDYSRLVKILRDRNLPLEQLEKAIESAVYPRWLRNSRALVPRTQIPGWLFNRGDLEGGEDLDEFQARKKAIYGMLEALRSRFWTLPAPQGYAKQKGWPGLHDQLMAKLASAGLSVKKLVMAAAGKFDDSIIAVGILIPTGIDEIFDSTQEAFSYIEQVVMGEDEPLQLAATLGGKMKITAEKAKILLEAASILEEADPNLATAIDRVLTNALDKQQMTEAEIVKGLIRVADKLDMHGATKEARLADSIIQELVQKKI